MAEQRPPMANMVEEEEEEEEKEEDEEGREEEEEEREVDDEMIDDEMIVEKLVAKRKNGPGQQYRVRWKGRAESEDSWVSRSRLLHARDKIASKKGVYGLGAQDALERYDARESASAASAAAAAPVAAVRDSIGSSFIVRDPVKQKQRGAAAPAVGATAAPSGGDGPGQEPDRPRAAAAARQPQQQSPPPPPPPPPTLVGQRVWKKFAGAWEGAGDVKAFNRQEGKYEVLPLL
eukprot:SAG11_NODE_1349_length_5137_cov_2.880905_5_plen_233_part_00